MAAPTMPSTGPSPEHQQPTNTTPNVPRYTAEEVARARAHIKRVKRNAKIAGGLVVTGLAVGAGAYFVLNNQAESLPPVPRPAVDAEPFGKANQVPLNGNEQAVAKAVVANHFDLLTEFSNRDNYDNMSNRVITEGRVASDLQILYTPDQLATRGVNPEVTGDTYGDELTAQAVRFGRATDTNKGFFEHDLVLEGTMVGQAQFGTTADGADFFVAKVHEEGSYTQAGGKPSSEKLNDNTCMKFVMAEVVMVPGDPTPYAGVWRADVAPANC